MLKVDILGGLFRDFIFYGNGVHADNILEVPGGTGFNVYKGLAELGVDVIFHGSYGKDWPFEKIGVCRDGKSGVFVSRNEKEVLSVYRGVNLLTKFEQPVSNVLFSSLECGGKVFGAYAEYMHGKGGIVILDPSPVFEWQPEFARLVDILIPNEKELKVIEEKNKSLNNITVFVKNGYRGGKVIFGNMRKEIFPRRIGKFPLACGDVFDTIVVWGTLKEKDLGLILHDAVAVSSLASLIEGSSPSVIEAVSHFAGGLSD